MCGMLKRPTRNRFRHDMKSPYPDDWDQIRRYVYRQANYTCYYCKKIGIKVNAHHHIPLSKGGTNNLDNLVCICDECHSILHPHNLNLEKTYVSSIESRYELDLKFDGALYEEFMMDQTDITLEEEGDFHSIEDNFKFPF